MDALSFDVPQQVSSTAPPKSSQEAEKENSEKKLVNLDDLMGSKNEQK